MYSWRTILKHVECCFIPNFSSFEYQNIESYADRICDILNGHNFAKTNVFLKCSMRRQTIKFIRQCSRYNEITVSNYI